MRNAILLGAAVLFTGCKKDEDESTALSAQDAQLVYAANYGIIADVMTSISSDVSASGKALTVTADGEGYTVTGTIDGGTTWTGSIDVDGAVSYADPDYSYSLDLGYNDVAYTGYNMTMNGTLNTAWEVTYPEAGGYEYYYAMDGNLSVTGDVEGTVDMNYSITVIADENGGYSYSAEGSIGGQDISGYAGA